MRNQLDCAFLVPVSLLPANNRTRTQIQAFQHVPPGSVLRRRISLKADEQHASPDRDTAVTSFGNALTHGFYFRPAVPFSGSKGESTNSDIPGPTEKIPRGRILDVRGGDPFDNVGKTAESDGRRAANRRLVMVTFASVAPLRGNGPRPAFPTRGPKAEAAEKTSCGRILGSIIRVRGGDPFDNVGETAESDG